MKISFYQIQEGPTGIAFGIRYRRPANTWASVDFLVWRRIYSLSMTWGIVT